MISTTLADIVVSLLVLTTDLESARSAAPPSLPAPDVDPHANEPDARDIGVNGNAGGTGRSTT